MIRLGAFGNGYNQILDEHGITSVLKSQGALSKRLEIRIPRSYLFRHDWLLGAQDSVLGLNAVVLLAGLDADSGEAGFPPNRRFVAAESRRHMRDATSLLTLRLSREPVRTWSVRFY